MSNDTTTSRLIRLLPSWVPDPELTESDGEVYVEWYPHGRDVLTVWTAAAGLRVRWMARFGTESVRGDELFNDTVPAPVLDLLRRFYY